MNTEDLNSIVISPENFEKIMEYLGLIENLLPNGLINLTPKERKSHIKMGDKNSSFVYIALDQAKLNPRLIQSSIKIPLMETNLKAVTDFNKISRYMTKINSSISDTLLVAGGDAFSTALDIYKAFQMGVKIKADGAKTGNEELKKSYPGHKPKPKDDNK